ncbi:MAG: hypothetical protein ACOCV4_06310 [Myxococcota bacterium]
MRTWLLTLAVIVAVAFPSRAEEPSPPTAEQLAERLQALSRHDVARDVADDTLVHARRALDRAKALDAQGDVAAARRATSIAAAAVLAAQRQVALAQERAARRRAFDRLKSARQRARLAKRARAQVAARLAEVRRGDSPPEADEEEPSDAEEP